MLTLHHLNNSRSQRIVWLLEELGLDYDLVLHQRDPVSRAAPTALKAIHRLGKAPVITDANRVVAESAAIIEYVLDVYGQGRLRPPHGTDAYYDYQHWLHYAEGSAALPFMLAMYVSTLRAAGAPLHGRITQQIDTHLGYIEQHFAEHDFLVGQDLTGADINMSFVLEAAEAGKRLAAYPLSFAYLKRLQSRPAYQQALARGGDYQLGAR